MKTNKKISFITLSKWVLYLGAVMATLVLSTLAIGQASSRQESLIVGTSFNLKTLDPGRSFELTAILTNKALYDTLVTLADDEQGDVTPQLARSWTVSADGLSYIFKLADGVRFSSGNPLTSADVVWSFQRFIGLKGPASFLTSSIKDVTAPIRVRSSSR